MIGLVERPSCFQGQVGVGVRDITPPFGIYSAVYGAAKPLASTGTHRPLLATALAFRATARSELIILVAIDHTEISDLAVDAASWVVGALANSVPIERKQVMVACSHTHSAPPLQQHLRDRPGGELFEEYADQLRRAVGEAAREAVASAVPATITWGTGKCDLAVNRDLPDPNSDTGRYICGFNPARNADDTLIVARVTSDDSGDVLATMVNYACHPTSLGWGNYLVSPDFIGSMRETIAVHTNSAPTVFLQGASGDLSPAEQYSDDPGVAERHGRRLGFASLAVLCGMLDARCELAFSDIIESGAPLAVWSPRPFEPDRTLVAEQISSEFPLQQWPAAEEFAVAAQGASSGWEATRVLRKQAIASSLGSKPAHATPAWVWRIGDAIVVGHPNEAYSDLQTSLRATFPDTTIMVANLVNDSAVVGYLPPRELGGLDLYQIWQTPFAPGSLEILIEDCRLAIDRLLAPGRSSRAAARPS